MAIQKTLIDNKGQVTTYHRIVAFAPVFGEGQQGLSVNLASYTNEQYREIEKTDSEQTMSVANRGIILPLRDDDTYTRANIYTAIMASAGWEDSVTV